MQILDPQEPLAVALREAIQGGDTRTLRDLLDRHPGLAAARIGPRSLLHVATDWPGHFPGVAATVATLAGAGADPGARFTGDHRETPLHWAASTNDLAALDALVEAGADVEADGAVIGGGTPLADARGFGQWEAARRLLALGAHADFHDAATLGLLDRVKAYVSGAEQPSPTPQEITEGFWGACHGGQLETARYLRDRGADIRWVGWDGKTPLDVARESGAEEVVRWLRKQGA
ncbi:ankyrin repeat domain-containing protein [Streptomyces purpureus]|uniref:ankyrin repeat domain-containing protein n=1 Tax=Streptomyces purpureus TaxID=1951 RepID=UPI00037825CC|nr:ankyrin repeat domain-containing protein [Streptomyces purpureus]